MVHRRGLGTVTERKKDLQRKRWLDCQKETDRLTIDSSEVTKTVKRHDSQIRRDKNKTDTETR